MIHCAQCGAKFIADLSAAAKVTCPRCGAVPVRSAPAPVTLPPPPPPEAPAKGLYSRVVCTQCAAVLTPPRPVAAGQPIHCRKCNTIFAAPGGKKREPARPGQREAEAKPPDEVSPDQVVVRRASRRQERPDTPVAALSRLADLGTAEDWEGPPLPRYRFEKRRPRQRIDPRLWVALSLGVICFLGLVAIIALIAFGRS